jgi:hypothetical protein
VVVDASSSAREHRRALALTVALLVAVGAVTYGPTVYMLVVGAEPTGLVIAIGLLGSGVLGTGPFLLADCLGPAVRVDDGGTLLLTGKTITGWRSVDLNALASVRYRYSMSYVVMRPGHLIVRDTSRACLVVCVDDRQVLRWLGSAVNRSGGRTVRMSPMAAATLHVPDHRRVVVRRDRGVLLRSMGLIAVMLVAYVGLVGATFCYAASG